jgi:hypothetical protein
MDMMGFLHPDLQLVFLFDWSSGHAKKQDGGLAVLQMNSKYGGKKGAGMRDTEMVEGCLGDGEAKLWKVLSAAGDIIGWFASAAEAEAHGSGTVIEVDCKLKIGDTQHMEFSSDADCPPPFYAPRAARDDCAKTGPGGVQVNNKKGEAMVVEGWCGKAKGLKQALWERGLWKDGMVLKVKPDDERGQDMCMQTTLHKCPDFNLEIGALTKLISDEGHICLFCAKGHPEIAGLGIEYDWGVSKKIFRKTNDQVAAHMQRHLDAALDAITLTIARRTARRARLYMRAYKTGKAHSHDLIEKFVKIHKCHRNILDQETKYLDKLVVLCQAAEVKLELLQREAETSGLKMYGADGGRLPLPHAAAGAGGAERAAEDSDSDSDDADSIIGDAESLGAEES